MYDFMRMLSSKVDFFSSRCPSVTSNFHLIENRKYEKRLGKFLWQKTNQKLPSALRLRSIGKIRSRFYVDVNLSYAFVVSDFWHEGKKQLVHNCLFLPVTNDAKTVYLEIFLQSLGVFVKSSENSRSKLRSFWNFRQNIV